MTDKWRLFFKLYNINPYPCIGCRFCIEKIDDNTFKCDTEKYHEIERLADYLWCNRQMDYSTILDDLNIVHNRHVTAGEDGKITYKYKEQK